MSDRPTKLVIDLSYPEGHEMRNQIVELTDEEIAEREVMAAQAEADRLAREAEEQAIAELKASAKAKLISGQPLTEEEAALIVI